MIWGRNRQERERRVQADRTSRLDALERENFILTNKLTRIEGSLRHMKSVYAEMKSQRDVSRKMSEQHYKTVQRLVHSLAAAELARMQRDNLIDLDAIDVDELVNIAVDAMRERERIMRDDIARLEDELEKERLKVSRLTERVSMLQNERLSSGPQAENVSDERKHQVAVTSAHTDESEVEAGRGRTPKEDTSPATSPRRSERGEDKRRERAGVKEGRASQTRDGTRERRSDTTTPSGGGMPRRAKPGKGGDDANKRVARQGQQSEHHKPDATVSKSPAASSLYVEDLAELGSKLGDEHRAIIEIIGTSGVFRTTELREHPRFLEHFSVNSNYYQQKIQDLTVMDILTQRTVKVGARGHIYDIFQFTPKGVQVYEALFNMAPVPSEIEKLVSRHGTPEHALLVADTRVAFEKAGFSVDDSHEGNTVRTPSGATMHFDLTVRRGGDVRRVECERAVQSDKDLHNKLSKWLEVSSFFYYVSPNINSRENLKRSFYRWAAKIGRDTLAEKGLVVHFATLEGLKRGESWEEVSFS